jgi:hypothetical protein
VVARAFVQVAMLEVSQFFQPICIFYPFAYRNFHLKAVIELSAKNDPSALKFFEDEYKVDHYIATMTTPFVSVMNGITSK